VPSFVLRFFGVVMIVFGAVFNAVFNAVPGGVATLLMVMSVALPPTSTKVFIYPLIGP